jgi:hypothetical protein
VRQLAELLQRFPSLIRAKLMPKAREGPGSTAEGIATGTQKRGTSYRGELQDGTGIELDDITPDGKVIDNKDWASAADLLRRRLRWTEGEPRPVDEQMRGNEARERAEARTDAEVQERLDKAEKEMSNQARFVREYGLTGGVEWLVNDPGWHTQLSDMATALHLDGIVKVTLVP